MAITDNNFTSEEFSGAIEKNPELLNHVTGALTSKQYIVRSAQAEAEFRKTFEDTLVGKKTKEFADGIEKDIKDLFGVEKTGDEKYYDYLKRAGTAVKTEHEKAKAELEELRKGVNPSEADRKRIAALEGKIGEDNKKWETEKSGYLAKIDSLRMENKFESSLSKLRSKYNAAIPESVVKIAEQTVVTALMATGKVNASGEIVFFDDKGEPRLNQTTMKPLTIDELLSEELKDLVDAGRAGAGAGGKGADPNEKTPTGGGPQKFTAVPADVKTKVDLHSYLQKLGYTSDSEDFNKLYTEHGAKLPLR